jgi:hypothetical protein
MSDTASSSAPIEPSVRLSSGPVRVTVDSKTGEATAVSLSQRGALSDVPVSPAGLTGRSVSGMPLDPSQFDSETIVSHPLIGDGKVSSLLASGLLIRMSEGYKLAGETSQTQPEDTEPKVNDPPTPEADPAVDPAEVALLDSLPSTSEHTNAFMKSAEEATSSQFLDGAMGVLGDTGSIESIEEHVSVLASHTGREKSEVMADVSQRIAERMEAAQKAAAGKGVDLESWDDLVTSMGDKRADILRAIEGKDMGPFLRACGSFVKSGGNVSRFTEDDLLSIEAGQGVDIRRGQNGQAVIMLPSGEQLAVRQALIEGKIKLSKARS